MASFQSKSNRLLYLKLKIKLFNNMTKRKHTGIEEI